VVKPNKDQQSESSTTGQGGKKQEKSNASAVIQTTSSESGSPAMLAEDNGTGRDGTNNIQRASYNMAGAKVDRDMRLSDKNHGERNINNGTSRIKKQEEQPIRTTIQGTTKKSQPTMDDQGVTKKNSAKESKRSKRKNRRNKDRDSAGEM
jgi:hypothetical protein